MFALVQPWLHWNQVFKIHSFTIKTIYDQDLAVGNALVDMYAKCGSTKDARLVFEMLIVLDIVSWNVMVSSFFFALS